MRRVRVAVIAVAAMTIPILTGATEMTLQEAWDTMAVPGGSGEPTVLDLDPDVVYTGGLQLLGGSFVIHGHGAVIVLHEVDQKLVLARV